MKKNNIRFGSKIQSAKSSPGRPPHGKPVRRGASQVPRGAAGGGQTRSKENEIPKVWRPVIGTHAIKEALNVRAKMAKLLWLRQNWESSAELREIQERTHAARIKIEFKADSVIDRFGTSHQGAVLFMSGAPTLSMEDLQGVDKSIVLILDGIEDPHNLGAILRTSWLMGVHGVIVPEDRAVGLTPTVHKVACGGAEHVPVVATTNFAKYAEEFKKMGYWIYGLSPQGKKTIFELQLPEKVIWAIGSEDKGMRVTTERICDELVYIPQSSAAASYNASVATAVALTETFRQHSNSGLEKNKSKSNNTL